MPKITITTDDMTIDVEKGYKMIELGEDHDTSILFGCRDGACGACMIKVLEGAENLNQADDNEKDFLETMAAEDNERLACQCVCNGDIKIEVSD